MREFVFLKTHGCVGKRVDGQSYLCHNTGRNVFVYELMSDKQHVEVFSEDVRDLTEAEAKLVGYCSECEDSGCGVCFEHARRTFVNHKTRQDRPNVLMLVNVAVALQSAEGGECRWQLGEDVLTAVNKYLHNWSIPKPKPDEKLYAELLAVTKKHLEQTP